MIFRIQFLLQMNVGVRKDQQDPFVKGQGCGAVRLYWDKPTLLAGGIRLPLTDFYSAFHSNRETFDSN